jgi:CheY-like chemotaxis protein
MTPPPRETAPAGDERAARDEMLAQLERLGQELRGPLAPISNALYLLRLRPGDLATVESARQVMERQVEHLVEIVDELLDSSRLARGTLLVEKEEVDLARVAAEAIEEKRPAFAAAEVALAAHLPRRPVWVCGERGRLAQVAGILLDRALQATGPGGRMSLRLEEEGELAALAVAPGAGAPRERLDPFSAGSPSARAKGGLGLALEVARGLVELHGGRLEAAGGGGLAMRLPRLAEPGAERGSSPAGRAAGRPLRIAIVEDDRDTAESLGVLLELLGHEVSRAHDGAQGVELVRRTLPDVVLCDIGLPGMNGFAVARALQADPETAGIRLVAITGYDQDEDRREGARAGFDRYLIKPVDPDDLVSLLAAYARELPAAPAGAGCPSPGASPGRR